MLSPASSGGMDQHARVVCTACQTWLPLSHLRLFFTHMQNFDLHNWTASPLNDLSD